MKNVKIILKPRPFVRVIAMKKIKSWFFKNLAAEILKQNPKIEIAEEKKRVPISSFESNDLYLSKEQEANEEENKFKGGE